LHNTLNKKEYKSFSILQGQFFYLQNKINPQSITDRNFKKFVYIPIPKDKSDNKKMTKGIKRKN
jgi:hypothetical protein